MPCTTLVCGKCQLQNDKKMLLCIYTLTGGKIKNDKDMPKL